MGNNLGSGSSIRYYSNTYDSGYAIVDADKWAKHKENSVPLRFIRDKEEALRQCSSLIGSDGRAYYVIDVKTLKQVTWANVNDADTCSYFLTFGDWEGSRTVIKFNKPVTMERAKEVAKEKKVLQENIEGYNSMEEINKDVKQMAKRNAQDYNNGNEEETKVINITDANAPKYLYTVIEFAEGSTFPQVNSMIQKMMKKKYTTTQELNKDLLEVNRIYNTLKDKNGGYVKIYLDHFISADNHTYKIHIGRTDIGDKDNDVKFDGDIGKDVLDIFNKTQASNSAYEKSKVKQMDSLVKLAMYAKGNEIINLLKSDNNKYILLYLNSPEKDKEFNTVGDATAWLNNHGFTELKK